MSNKESRIHSGIHKSHNSVKHAPGGREEEPAWGGLHNVDLSKRLSRGIYSWQQQGHKSGVVTEAAAAAVRRSTVQQCA